MSSCKPYLLHPVNESDTDVLLTQDAKVRDTKQWQGSQLDSRKGLSQAQKTQANKARDKTSFNRRYLLCSGVGEVHRAREEINHGLGKGRRSEPSVDWGEEKGEDTHAGCGCEAGEPALGLTPEEGIVLILGLWLTLEESVALILGFWLTPIESIGLVQTRLRLALGPGRV